MLPGNTHLLVSAWNTSGPDAVEVLDRASGKAQSVVTGASFARYFQAPDGSEYLVYAVGSSLYGVRFNLGALRTEGSPVLLASESTIPPDMGFMDVSGDAQSILTYLTGTLSGASVRTSIASLDSSGNTTPIASSVAAYYTPRYSPDGQLLAYVKDGDIWTHDSITGVSTQRTFAARAVGEIAWTPDGRHLLYSAQNKIWWLRADGSGQPLALISGDETFRVFSVSPDGRTVSVGVNRLGLPDLYFLPLDTSNSERPVAGKLTPFVVTPEPEAQGEFSPDGRWIAYSVSGQADGAQVFVQPFPPNGSKWRVSAVEGDFPQWSRDGHLYYLAGDQIMVTDWSVSGGAFVPGRPRVWSPTRIQPIANQLPLALHPDGKHFAVFPKPTTEREHLHAVFMLNPVELIRRGLTAK